MLKNAVRFKRQRSTRAQGPGQRGSSTTPPRPSLPFTDVKHSPITDATLRHQPLGHPAFVQPPTHCSVSFPMLRLAPVTQQTDKSAHRFHAGSCIRVSVGPIERPRFVIRILSNIFTDLRRQSVDEHPRDTVSCGGLNLRHLKDSKWLNSPYCRLGPHGDSKHNAHILGSKRLWGRG